MARASTLHALSDADLDRVRHEIRRKVPAAGIAAWVSERLGRTVDENVIYRYATGPDYGKWATWWRDRELEKEREIAAIRERYQLLGAVLKDGAGIESDGVDDMARVIQARLLALAVEADEAELKEAAGAKGWISQTLKMAMDLARDKWRKQVGDLKAEIVRISQAKREGGSTTDYEEVLAKVDSIMGLK